jgi:hypothetical protein
MNMNNYQPGRAARIRNLITAAAPVPGGVLVAAILVAVSTASPAWAAPLSRAATAAASPSASPAVEVCGEGSALVRPSSMVLTCADHGMIADNLSWSSWTATRATATGTVTWQVSGNQSDSTTAGVTLTDPVHKAGKQILFTKLDMHVTGSTPPGFLRDAIFSEAPEAAASPAPSAQAQSPATSQSPLPAVAPRGTLGYAQIEGYWVDAGGPSGSDARIAAAITFCESSFEPGIIQAGQPYSTTGWGLWQITPGNSVSQYGTDFRILDPWNNAEAAVNKFDGAGGFTPWTTFIDGCYAGHLQSTSPDTELSDPGEYVQINSAPSGTPSSPAAHPGSSYGPLMPGLTAFQANTGDQWIYTSSNSGHRNTGLGMAKATSPAIAPDGTGFEVAFQANTGKLWIDTPAGNVDTGLGMAAGTSPSIAGGEVAFQANTGDLWVYTSSNSGHRNTGLGMAKGTSPSIAGGEVAFQANTGKLWIDTSARNVDTGLGMAAKTSPSIYASSGGLETAFRANTGDLWIYTLANSRHRNTGLGMAADTGPSITD